MPESTLIHEAASPAEPDKQRAPLMQTAIGLAEGKLAYALILGLALTLILALWAGVTLKILAEKENTEQTLKRDTLNLARAFEAHAVRTITGADQSLRFLQQQYELHGRQIDIRAFVRDGLIISTIFNQLGIIDENGTYILSNLPNHQPIDLSDREHFRVHRDRVSDELWVSKPVLGRATGKWSIQMTRRIDKPDGSFGGVAVISIDPFYFTSLYNDMDIGRDGIITVVGLDGIVRARRTSNDAPLNAYVGRDISGSPLMKMMEQQDQGHIIYPSHIDGIERIYSFRKVEGLPLAVVVGVGREEAMAPYMQRRNEYVLFAGVMSAVVLLFGLLSAFLLRRQRGISERLRISRAKAESANRLKSEFLASISHELRTPLNGIIGYAQFLKEMGGDATAREFGGIIHGSSRHLLALVNDILDQASIEAGRMQLHDTSFSLSDLVRSALDMHRSFAEGRGLDLGVDCQAGLPTSIRCDRTRLLQILSNLLHNAIKFTEHGQVRLKVFSAQRDLCFAVEDTGPGIPAEQQMLIFERFRQADTFVTRKHEGSGLGLALSRDLATMMGGCITLQSAPGQGSTFTLRLPLQLMEEP
ncbi:sensor histidine kinase [Pseudomonas oryzae]|uniref:histidine kinase n=1 Tax=Pseudomonas oryzae TaxID=1392877 RepID=A0A1H1R6L7_9PSED|nr:hybrid sensor histidine kinase/response regulator [Pseudomonas oryzae]SDS31176.1 Signal transduction histidine kinase [Pseudomonas oryzae]